MSPALCLCNRLRVFLSFPPLAASLHTRTFLLELCCSLTLQSRAIFQENPLLWEILHSVFCTIFHPPPFLLPGKISGDVFCFTNYIVLGTECKKSGDFFFFIKWVNWIALFRINVREVLWYVLVIKSDLYFAGMFEWCKKTCTLSNLTYVGSAKALEVQASVKLCVCKSQPGDEGDEEETLQGASNPVFSLTSVMRYIQGKRVWLHQELRFLPCFRWKRQHENDQEVGFKLRRICAVK